jgi:hypothetical protein
MLAILILLNLALAVMAGIFGVKKVLVDFHESKSKLKNVGILFFLVITLILSLFGGINAITTEDLIDQYRSDLLRADTMIIVDGDGKEINRKEEIQRDLEKAESKKIDVSIITIMGYLTFGCLWALRKNIVKEINNAETTGS